MAESRVQMDSRKRSVTGGAKGSPESEDRGIAVMHGVAANDNGGAEARIDTAVLTLARLIGRRIAREELDRLDAANDNAPAKDTGEK